MRRLPLFILLMFSAVTTGAQSTSREALTANRTGQYSVLKRTFEALFASGSIKPEVFREGNTVDLYTCQSGSEFLWHRSKGTLVDDADLAYEIASLKSLLTSLGYPPETWQSLVTRYETDLLAARTSFDRRVEVKSAYLDRLVTALNDYRRRVDPSLSVVMSEGGCGADEIGVKIRTVPSDGRVEFIPVFFYELCRKQAIDPDDAGRCNWWREPTEGVLFEVAGDYFYRAVWRDGRTRKGRLSFTKLENGQVVTFRKP